VPRTLQLSLALLVLVSPAFAQQRSVSHSAGAVGPRAVFYAPSDADHGQWGQGVQLKLPAGPDYAMQISVDRSKHSAAGANYKDLPIQVSLLGYFMPESPGSFYLLLGMGHYRVTVDGPGAHTENSTRPHIGAGLEVLGDSRFSLDASYRFIWSGVWRLNDYAHPWGSGFHKRGTMYTLSIAYRF
jgi:hypothetical protein